MENVEEILPLAPAQEGMLYECIGPDAAPGTYVGLVTADIDGRLEPDALRAAMEEVLRARDAYRACFVWKRVSRPLQVIRKAVELPFTFHDLSDLDQSAFAARREALMESERVRGFDLTAPPLMRLTLLRRSPADHHLIWAVHHMVSDGWSTGAVLEDLTVLLAGGRPSHPAQYRDYLGWRQARDTTAEAVFWRDYLAGISGPTVVAAHVRDRTGAARRERQHVAGLPLAPLRDHARRHKVTLSTLLTTAWALVLRRYSGADDVLFGQTHSGRPASLKGVDRAVGAFINTLPLRVTVDPQLGWAETLARAEASASGLRRHQFAGLPEVRKAAALGRDTPLFETLFVVEDVPVPPAGGQPVSFRNVQATDESTFPLAVLATPGDSLSLEAIHDPRRLPGMVAGRILADFARLLARIPEADGTVSELIGASWAEPVDGAEHSGFVPVSTLILARAAETPAATALVCPVQGRMSYGALADASRGIAARLQALGVGPGDIVPIALERSADVVVAMLGVLRTGAAYVPLDLDYPAERLSLVLDTVAAKAIVTGLAASDRLPATIARQIFLDEPDGPAGDLVEVSPEPGDPAYVIFTSGSTGGPKGVVVSHANLHYSTAMRDTAYPEPPGAFLMLSSFAFDSSVVGIYWTLTKGGTLVVSGPRLEQDMTLLGETLEREKITHLLCLPALYRAILDAVPQSRRQHLRTAIVAGEAVGADLVHRHRQAMPKARLFNEYGPTEATVWCAFLDITDHDPAQDVPIGFPPAGTTLVVADPDGHPLPPLVRGEILVSGPGVAVGYLGDPEATRAAFTGRGYATGDLGYREPQGPIVFQGRRDAQVKVRGHRVELAEVEAALSAAANAPAVVIARPAGSSVQLAGFVAGTHDCAALRHALMLRLPGYMVPQSIMALDEFPHLPNGKTDLRALLEMPTPAGSASLPPSGFAETRIAEIWADVLGRDGISRDDDFFDLGGDSLRTIAVGLKAEDAGLPLAAHDLFEFPVLKDLAAQMLARAEAADPVPHDNCLAFADPGGDKPLFFMVHGSLKMHAYLGQALGKSRPLAFLFSHFVGGRISASDRLEDLARDAVARLRSIRPNGPYHLGGYSLGALVALEMARMLRTAGEPVEVLFLLDPSYAVHMPGQAGSASRRLMQNAIGQALMMYYRSAETGTSDNARAHMAYVGNAYRKMLTHYRPGVYDGPVHVMLTEDVRQKLGDRSWLDAALPNRKTDLLPFGHLELQKDPDALVRWTSALAALLNGTPS